MISWISHTQHCVTNSTSEAKYLAMTGLVEDALFVRHVLTSMVHTMESKCISINVDNEGAINAANNPLS